MQHLSERCGEQPGMHAEADLTLHARPHGVGICLIFDPPALMHAERRLQMCAWLRRLGCGAVEMTAGQLRGCSSLLSCKEHRPAQCRLLQQVHAHV